MAGSPARELSRLVQLQRDKLQALESRLLGCEAELQDWEGSAGQVNEVSENLIRLNGSQRACFSPKTLQCLRVHQDDSASCGSHMSLDCPSPVFLLLSSSK